MSKPNKELKNIIEAALLVSGQALTIKKMQAMFPPESRPTREEVRDVLDALEKDYANRGVELKQIDRAYRFQSREKYADWVMRLIQERPPRYSRALLETLAIIAYRQPVTRGDIEAIRGVSVSSDIIRTLLEREWVRQVGTRDVPGRPALFGTARAFLEYFNLKSLEDLPPLAELRDLGVISAELDLKLDIPSDRGKPPDSETQDAKETTHAGGTEAVSLSRAQSAAGE
ncbi:MAG: SMC-Scp complex subunit ScpB [Gammaproteobacteria bacterium]|nr:MAG: SMC-Scp complex subunit ScpB [Gammaproteobacteria bacterium]